MDKNVFKFIALRLKELRLNAGLSQSQLGDVIGVSFQQIQKYEVCHNKIAVDYLVKFAEFFNVGLDYFFQDYYKNMSDEDFEIWRRFVLLSSDKKKVLKQLILSLE